MKCNGFYFPPHPSNNSRIRRDQLDYYEGLGQFVAQLKYNGTQAVFHVNKDKYATKIWDRRGKEMTLYQLTPEMRELIAGLNIKGGKEYVFNGELLHTKAISPRTGEQAARHTIVLYDLLFAGEYLYGKTFEERYDMLTNICRVPTKLEDKKRGLLVSTNGESKLWLAQSYKDDFVYHYDCWWEETRDGKDKWPEIEGLVLKNKNGNLLGGDRLEDVKWIIRVRKAKEKIYSF